MADPGGRRSAVPRRRNPGPRRAWCCSLGGAPPQSPDRRSSLLPSSKHPSKPPPYPASFNSSPSPSSKPGRSIFLSPGRVSPIDSDAPLGPAPPEIPASASALESEPASQDPLPDERSLVPTRPETAPGTLGAACLSERCLDLRLILKGKDGWHLVLELDPEVLCENSSLFAARVLDSRRKVSVMLAGCREIEITDIENLDVYRETVELMYERDLMRRLMKAGVSRTIDILEVSSTIMFDRGVMSCLKYLEAVPWTENEEEKLKNLFARHRFDEATSQDVLARLGPKGSTDSEDLTIWLVQSVANGMNGNARKEMQSLVSGLLSKSSVYQKDPAGLNKDSLYSICHSCLNSLVELFEEASNSTPADRAVMTKETKPLVERISKQVENLRWLLEILIEKQMAEDFVGLWANQEGLFRMHERSSPMVRYELSRVSASVFIALGSGKLQCRGNVRLAVLSAWFGPMLLDFGWLQRCSKGLDMRMLEESLGQAILTLPLKMQQSFFEEWFQCFAGQGSESPNLSKAFQVWWRRSFVRSSEALS